MRNEILLVTVMFLAGCSGGLDGRIDATSEASYKASLAKMREKASPGDAKSLEDAIRVLAISDVSIGFEGGIVPAMEKMRAKPPESLADAVMPQVNAKTGREIVAAAAKRKQVLAEKQLPAVMTEIAALKKAQAEKETSKGFLAKIEILEPRIAVVGSGTSRMGILDFKVQNGSEEALASLFLRATVSGGGKVLLTDEFTYRASPPIAAAQTREVRLPSSTPGKWNSPQLAGQADLALQLQVENASTAAGSRLAASFTQKDADRLALLEKLKPQLEAFAAAR